MSTVQFTAHVRGTTNTAVNWSVTSGVAGQGCGGAACGTVSATGLYSAPSTAPSPNQIAVTATSATDGTKSATAMVALTSGPAIEVVLPSSVMAGVVEGFPLSVEGVNFVAGSRSGASAILLNGTARSTTCQTATLCSIALTPADVQSATNSTLQVQNPGSPGTLSNVVPFVVIPFDVSRETITLTAGSPAATGLNFVVTEPTTAAGESVTGIFGGHVVAVDADSGAVIAGTIGTWSCGSGGTTEFDGSFAIERLPVQHNYILYAEPLDGIATGGDFSVALDDLCAAGGAGACTTPAVNTNFNGRMMPAGP